MFYIPKSLILKRWQLNTNEKIDDFLRDMERFSVAVNEKIYDIDIINQMSRTLLLCQYSDVEDFIATKDEKYYNEYKKN